MPLYWIILSLRDPIYEIHDPVAADCEQLDCFTEIFDIHAVSRSMKPDTTKYKAMET